jgi:hypothetical protein
MQIESALTDAIRPARPVSVAPLADPSAIPEAAGSTFTPPDVDGAGASRETGGAFGQVVSTIGGPLTPDAVAALQQAPATENRPETPVARAPDDETRQQAQISAFAPPPPPREDNVEPPEDEETGPEEEEQPTETEEEGADGLTPEEERQVQELRQRDAEVRRHEQAHAAAGGQYAGAPSYEYQRGPDGRLYAVGGEVRIDTSPIPGNPQATIAKMQTVRRAALAPAQPSPQDQRVAAQAQREIASARAELRDLQAAERAEAAEDRATDRADGVDGVSEAPNVPATEGQRPRTVEAVVQVGAVADTNPVDVTTVTRVTAGLSSPPFVDESASQNLRAAQAFLNAQNLSSPAERAAVFA